MTPALSLPLGRPLRVGGLFAGYGGLELALQLAFGAVDLEWLAEVDPAACRILATRFPGVPNLGDVTAVDWAAAAPIDLLAGGSPCQDLSQAGKRLGMTEGTRSNLWVAMREAIAVTRPRFVVWENVRGAYSACAQSEVDSELGPCPRCLDPNTSAGHAPHLRALGRVLGDLSSLGYDAAWTGLRAADVGAPHGRFRVFVLAWDTTQEGNLEPAAGATGLGGRATLADAEDHRREGSLAGRPAPLRTGPASVADGAGDASATAPDGRRKPGAGQASAGRASIDAGRSDGAAVTHLLPTPAVNDMGAGKTVGAWDAWTQRMRARHGNGNGHGNSLHIEALRMLPTPRATDGTKGGPNQRGSAGDLMRPSAVTDHQAFGVYTPAIQRWESTLGRLTPAPTEPTGRGGAQRLAPRFVEWMQGLSGGWVTDTDTTRNEQLRALGNGVVPQQAAAALHRLLALHAAVTSDEHVSERPAEPTGLAA
ncbi:DNA cytosine methyltransferase [Promicromonospora sp. NPDC057488]|uniref:DNA cytosine methyltransferase n=1 Tax=Promicromonospora sp. NPDC057488 TaxID=3346147 RepID=UPI00366CB6A8